ncbi:DNA repair protein XRCC4 [Anabarilius grahami]|uniref:DNA repair protein XRCC4 n=1 Tax=Anabarilius grahami TaxID=495550 RepID=A0A3N0Z6L0_ANAGA|nr:DNA repair protein XRCC4 [Anabarilius grahami]
MFFLKLEWAKDLGSGFIILLSDGVSAWSGEVSEEDVSREAQEIEMERERYVGDLHLALTVEGPAAEGEYSFHLTPERPGSPLLQLSYEKVQNDISCFQVLRQNADSILAGSCISITRMRHAAHLYSIGQY